MNEPLQLPRMLPYDVDPMQWRMPIRLRQFDWIATAEDYEPGDPIGSGATKQAAVDDLIEQYLEIEQ
jgi:hypothetical protein